MIITRSENALRYPMPTYLYRLRPAGTVTKPLLPSGQSNSTKMLQPIPRLIEDHKIELLISIKA